MGRAALFAAFVAVAALGFRLRGDDLRGAWLARRSLDQLRAQAQHSPNDPLVWYVYAQKLLRENQADVAVPAFEQAARALPSGASGPRAEQIHAYAGYLLARQGRAQEALPHLDAAHKINDEDALVAVGYGILFAQQDKQTYAATQFQLAATLEPKNVEAWFRLGIALNADSRFEQGEEALRHALALAPNDAASHAALGRALAAQNKSGAALGEYRRAHDLAPDNEAYAALLGTLLGQSARLQADYQESAALMDMALKLHPDDAALATELGALHLRFNAPRLALPYLQCAVTLLPQEAQGWYSLARAQTLCGNADEAARTQARFRALRALTSDVSVASKRIAAAPADPVWRLRLAGLYLRQEEWEAARAQYSIALSLQPDNREAKRAVDDLRRRIAGEKALKPAHAPVTLGPPPPPGLQIYDPDHELPAFRPTPDAPPVSPPSRRQSNPE